MWIKWGPTTGVAEHLLSADSVQQKADTGAEKKVRSRMPRKFTSYQPLARDCPVHHFIREHDAYRIIAAGHISRNSTRKWSGTESDWSRGQVRNIRQVTREGAVNAKRPVLPREGLGGDVQDRGKFRAKFWLLWARVARPEWARKEAQADICGGPLDISLNSMGKPRRFICFISEKNKKYVYQHQKGMRLQ